MIKEMLSIFVVLLLVAVGEVIYITSSPRIGVIDDSYSLGEDDIFISEDIWEAYSPFYKHYTPHKRDFTFYKPNYKLMIFGSEILMIGEDNYNLGRKGVLPLEKICIEDMGYANTSEALANCSEMLMPATISSEFLSPPKGNIGRMYPPLDGVEISTDFNSKENMSVGESDDVMYLSWHILADIEGYHSLWFFEDKEFNICLNETRMGKCLSKKRFNRSERRKEYAKYLEHLNIRSKFIQTFWEEDREYFEGIKYLSYYPYYNSILLFTSINKSEFETLSVYIDDEEYPVDKKYPLIFVKDVKLNAGKHTLAIKSSKEYTSNFNVQMR